MSSVGGAISIIGAFEVILTECLLINNIAKKGGALYVDCGFYNCFLNLNNCSFVSNRAITGGGALSIASKVKYNISMNYFKNNTASVGNDLDGFPANFLIYQGDYKTDTLLSLSSDDFLNNKDRRLSCASGQKTSLVVFVRDDFDNYLTYLDEGYIKIISDDKNIIIEGNQAIVSRGVAAFDSIYFFGKPKTITNISLQYMNKNSIFSTNQSIFLRNCQRGEIFTNNLCVPCEYGFFSLNSNFSSDKLFGCEVCPAKAECFGRDIILPKEGYFRLHSETSILVSCKINSACPPQAPYFEASKQSRLKISNSSADLAPFYQQVCKTGYTGNLCDRCEINYSKIAEGFCVRCSDDTWFLLKYLIISIASCCFMNLQAILALDFQDNESKKRSLLKIIINHTYFFIQIGKFQLNWKNDFLNYLAVSDLYIASVPKQMFSFECFISPYFRGYELDSSAYIITFFQPFVLVFFCFLLRVSTIEIYLYLKARKFLKNRKDDKSVSNLKGTFTRWFLIIRVLGVICMYNIYPRTLDLTLELLKCISLDDGPRTFMEKFPDYACWESSEHKKLLLIGFLPNFLIWCLVWPFFLFFALKKKNDLIISANSKAQFSQSKSLGQSNQKIFNSKNLENELKNKHQLFNFLIMDYKLNCYYWDIFFYSSNLTVSCFVVFASRFGLIAQGGGLITLFLIFLLVSELRKPFRFNYINQVQAASYLILVLTTAFSLVTTETFFNDSKIKMFYLVLIIVLNFSYYLIWLVLYLKALLISLRRSIIFNSEIILSYLKKYRVSKGLMQKKRIFSFIKSIRPNKFATSFKKIIKRTIFAKAKLKFEERNDLYK